MRNLLFAVLVAGPFYMAYAAGNLPPVLPADHGIAVVRRIVVEGNHRTREKVILREMTIRAGDTVGLDRLMLLLEQDRNQLINTALFTEVTMNLKNWMGDSLDVYVTVRERWYTFPFPIFELADRNFNVWWVEKDRDFSRTDYGIRFYQENCRGRNERLKAVLQMGFTQKSELFYSFPFIDRRQKTGLKYGISYSRNRELAYKTRNNKQIFFESTDFIRHRFYTALAFTHRNAINYIHSLDLKYHFNRIDDTLAALNPAYFLDSAATQRYLVARYAFDCDFRDIKAYPLTGSQLMLEGIKTGFGLFSNDVNIWTFAGQYGRFWKLGGRHFLAGKLKLKYSWPVVQPYFNQEGFGYRQDFVRGYEYYVVDGQQYGLFKTDYKYRLFSRRAGEKNKAISRIFGSIPFAAYLKGFFDAGYVKDDFFYLQNGNYLENSLLLGGGIGLDMVTYYDLVMRVELSFNARGEHGVFLHFKSPFE